MKNAENLQAECAAYSSLKPKHKLQKDSVYIPLTFLPLLPYKFPHPNVRTFASPPPLNNPPPPDHLRYSPLWTALSHLTYTHIQIRFWFCYSDFSFQFMFIFFFRLVFCSAPEILKTFSNSSANFWSALFNYRLKDLLNCFCIVIHIT